MYTFITDSAAVLTNDSVIFQGIQQGQTNAQWVLKNVGGVTINYHAQVNNGSTYVDVSAQGTDLNNTLQVNQVKLITCQVDYPQVRLMANASGGSTLIFSITRDFDRSDGGDIPILSF